MIEEIKVHPLTSNPTAAWEDLSKTQKVLKLNVKTPSKSVDSDNVRFVCMSDTHSLIRNIIFDIPDGDVFIHAGDFTKCGQKEEVIQFNSWLGTLPHKYKMVIAGNHELSFDEQFADKFKNNLLARQNAHELLLGDVPNYGNTRDNIFDAVNTENIRKLFTNCVYLEDSGMEIYGIKLWGSPWQPEFGNWAFNLRRGEECLSKWNLIPKDTEVLITHGPPLGHGDLVCSGIRAGCAELLSSVQKRIKPKYHIFGHIHEGYGYNIGAWCILHNLSIMSGIGTKTNRDKGRTWESGSAKRKSKVERVASKQVLSSDYGVTSDGEIIFINASTCDINYIPKNLPIVFDIPLKKGYVKN